MGYKTYALKDIGDIISGSTPKTSEPENFGGDIAWITPADLSGYSEKYISYGARNLTQKGYDSCSTQLIPPGTVLFSSRAPIGYVAIAKNPVCTNQGFKSVVPKPWVNSEFLYYQLMYLRKSIQNMGSGTTFKEISGKKFGMVQVTVPPLLDQERIVSRIEELLSQLDASVAELKTAKDRLKVYRQAVLKEAFEGTLTAAEKLGTTLLRSYIENPRYGTSKKCDYAHSGKSVDVYRIPNIDYRTGQISREDMKYTEFPSNELDQIKLESGDILIIRSNGSVSLVGRAALIREVDTKGTFAGYLMRLRIKDKSLLVPKFLLYYLQSHEARIYIENKAKSTSGVHNINSTEISGLKIPVFRVDDQRSIVATIESRLSVCDSIERTVNTALQQSEALRQSILKKAFEGDYNNGKCTV